MLVNLIAPVFAILWTISKQSQFRGCTAVTGTIINKQALLIIPQITKDFCNK